MYPLSDHFNGRLFRNSIDVVIREKGFGWKLLRGVPEKTPRQGTGKKPGPFATNLQHLQNPPAIDVQLTWLGHSTVLLQVGDVTLLINPVWHQRASPFTHLGPKRFFQPPKYGRICPHLDTVLLSHDHYDHLGPESHHVSG